jgi:hypothetical protein
MEWTLYPRGAMEWRGVDSKTVVDWMDFSGEGIGLNQTYFIS